MMRSPRDLAEGMERSTALPTGSEERFAGYGVMGLPFSSGDVLAFRRMTASSLGPAYTTVWHRDPGRRWTFFTDVDPLRSCPRFFGEALSRVVEGEIRLGWEGPFEISLGVPEARLQWGVRLSSDGWTRGVSAVGGLLPPGLRKRGDLLSAMGGAAGRMLGLGKMALTGLAPNGQRYRAAPRLVWRVEASAAILDSRDLGEIGSLSDQARLGDFWIPNRGIFALGEARFEAFDPERHSMSTMKSPRIIRSSGSGGSKERRPA